MDLGPKPEPAAEPAEPEPGGPDAPRHEPSGVVRDIRASNPPTGTDENYGMGVSSERIGHTGPGQTATDGIKDTSVDHDGDTDVPPEQRPGNEETNPVGIEPKAGYPTLDPRSRDD
jgi:hypothetical protein